MKRIGFSASPLDAEKSIRNISDFKCKKRGGEGAFREFVDVILNSNINS